MSAAREAIILPVLFLTVALLGGLRIAETVRLVPPPLMALVLGLLLVGTLARAGALAPDRLMNADRPALENLSGLVVLVTLFAASAQVFNLVTPERGLLHAIFSIGFFVQLATTLAGVTGRASLLRSLLVLLGSAFILRFVILESLYAPDGRLLKRLVTTLLEGVSLGGIEYQPNGAATGYVAFFTLVLYMTGLALLPPVTARGRARMRALQRTPRTDLVLLLMVIGFAAGGCVSASPAGDAKAPTGDEAHRAQARDDALRRARVWHPPPKPIADVDFARNPEGPGGFQPSDEISCRFSVQKRGGLTPKFHCEMADGQILKVKYGRSNGELPTEVAATRLLAALGFGADRMYVVRKVRCAGCPRFPHSALKCAERTGLKSVCFWDAFDYGRTVDFDPVIIERSLEGSKIEATDDQGWAWYELDRIDAAYGGSPRSEVDALRLLAVLLGHWDNKASNQRLLCLPGGDGPDGSCATPLAMIQDVGATFGPNRADLHNWQETPVWADRATCTVSMKTLPYRGATFPDRRISEEGRRMLLALLEQLSERQIADLFTASRMIVYDQVLAEAHAADAWVRAFEDKVRQIREGPPCPS